MTPTISPFMLVKARKNRSTCSGWRRKREPYMSLPHRSTVRYQVNGGNVTLTPAKDADDNFASSAPVESADWIEAEQLFGCVRQFNGEITLQPDWCTGPTAAY